MHVARIHLKTDCKDRTELIDYCLGRDKKYVAIGWSVVYENGKNYKDYKSYYYGVREYATSCNKKLNHALNVFRDVESGDLFWTRDLSGFYWICRALGKAEPRLERDLDIGSIVPVDAYKVGTEVPGKIKASFNRPRSGIVEYIDDDKIMEYSKFIFNQVSKTELYEIKIIENNILDSLPDFDLEELVISYLQLKRNY